MCWPWVSFLVSCVAVVVPSSFSLPFLFFLLCVCVCVCRWCVVWSVWCTHSPNAVVFFVPVFLLLFAAAVFAASSFNTKFPIFLHSVKYAFDTGSLGFSRGCTRSEPPRCRSAHWRYCCRVSLCRGCGCPCACACALCVRVCVRDCRWVRVASRRRVWRAVCVHTGAGSVAWVTALCNCVHRLDTTS